MSICTLYAYLAVCQTSCSLCLSAFRTSANLFVCLPISLLGGLPPWHLVLGLTSARLPRSASRSVRLHTSRVCMPTSAYILNTLTSAFMSVSLPICLKVCLRDSHRVPTPPPVV
jgi:hypothetical protein